jgi:hypothetical protein
LAGSQLARSACLAVNQVKVTPLFVAYCENVTVVGSPILKLDDGGTATYTSGPWYERADPSRMRCRFLNVLNDTVHWTRLLSLFAFFLSALEESRLRVTESLKAIEHSQKRLKRPD